MTMAVTHIFAIGRISKGHASLRVAPTNSEAASQLNAYLEESLCTPWLTTCLPMASISCAFTPDGQRFSQSEAEEADDYEDYLDEIEWIRKGCE